MIYIEQIIMLWILSLYSAMGQLYFNKTGKNKRKKDIIQDPSAKRR